MAVVIAYRYGKTMVFQDQVHWDTHTENHSHTSKQNDTSDYTNHKTDRSDYISSAYNEESTDISTPAVFFFLLPQEQNMEPPSSRMRNQFVTTTQHTTTRDSLCTCLYINVYRHLHDDTSLYYITFFVGRYINKTGSLLLKDTGQGGDTPKYPVLRSSSSVKVLTC